MRNRGTWTAFLLMCFAVTGLAGLFASYATSLPLQRALSRSAALDQVLAVAGQPDAPARLEALRPALGTSAAGVLSGTGDLAHRVASARAVMLAEQEREARSVAYRVRLMLGVITLLASGLGAGILAFASKGAPG